MSLVISKVFTYDTDAGDYIQRVEGASGDNQALEPATRQAINNFVIGCKQDGIWNAIKASCILSGARTLNGALQPLAGTAPTNFNFVTGDYNRKTGLVGDGSTKYLNSNRANNADPQNNSHIAARVSNQSQNVIILSGDNLSTGRNSIDDTGIVGRFDCRTFGSVSAARINANTLTGVSRSSSVSFNYRLNGSTVTQTAISNPPDSVNTFVFARSNTGVIQSFSTFCLAFYSIGESLDLALLDARVTALITAFGVAIP
jgi:hypothetical protein